jgi:hypothetical protein
MGALSLVLAGKVRRQVSALKLVSTYSIIYISGYRNSLTRLGHSGTIARSYNKAPLRVIRSYKSFEKKNER